MAARPPTPDALLLDRLAASRRGDDDAANDLARDLTERLRAYYERRLGARGRRWFGPEELAAEVLPEVLRVLEDLPAGARPEELLARVYRVARTRMIDAIRNHRRLAGESQIATWHEGGGSSTGPVTRADTRRFVRETIARLPAAYAEVLRLCGLEELSFVEAAEELGLSPDAVRKRYHRAHELLAERVRGTQSRG